MPSNNSNSSGSFWFLHLNIQGFSNNNTDLSVLLENCNKNVKVISLNEHWLNETNVNILNTFGCYKVGDYFCRVNKIRGGSAILLSQEIKFKVREDLKYLNEENSFECSFVEVNEWNTLFISIYRIPNIDIDRVFFQKFENLLSKLSVESLSKNILIASDHNIDFLKIDNRSKSLQYICQQYGFKYHFSQPTRITSTSKSCIDNIFSNMKSMTDKAETLILNAGAPDHEAILLSLSDLQPPPLLPSKASVSFKRKFNVDSLTYFRNCLVESSWIFDPLNSVDENYNSFLNYFLMHFNQAFPLKPSNFNSMKYPCKSWITTGIKVSAERKRCLHLESRWNKSKDFQDYVKKYRYIFKKIVNLSKKKYNDHYIVNSCNKTTATWEVVKRELGHQKKSNEIPYHIQNDTQQLNNLAKQFNEQFLSAHKVVKSIPNVNTALNNIDCNSFKNVFKFKTITENELSKIVLSLSNTKACGWDQIPLFVLKNVIDVIKTPLCHLINQSLVHGIFPNKLKFSEIIPLHKKKDVNILEHYRPISLLPSISKIFEKTVDIQLRDFLENNNIFNDSQFGFRKGLSVQQSLAKLINCVADALDGSQRTTGVLCDLTRAFECVHHSLLIKKLEKYGIKNKELKWFISYLGGRYQRTKIFKYGQTVNSSWEKVEVGVPQGSILGPCLFLIYVNDLPNVSNMNVFQFADDTVLLCRGPNIDSLRRTIDKELSNLKRWFEVNGLSLNMDKTQVINFRSDYRNSLKPVISSNTQLVLEETVNFLGIHLNENLNWLPHINQLGKKLNSAIFSLRTISQVTDFRTQLTVYHSYFSSLMSYGILVWGISCHSKQIFKLQKKAVRIIAKAPPRTPCKPIFQKLKLLTLYDQYILEIVFWVYNNLSIFMEGHTDHVYNTRHKNLIKPTSHRLTQYENSPQYIGPKLFNKIPNNLKNISSPAKFKKKLKDWLLSKTFYSLDEFLIGNWIV
jgi:hypothetical protein